jgi:DNA invertase Pin-like site-specific DNA recombinase
MKAALYVRVSTVDQHCENQLADLNGYVAARGWEPHVYTDRGVSGAKAGRPALNHLLRDAKRRKIDVLVVWRLDRLGRSLRHLILLLDELAAVGVGFVSLNEGIDTSTPAGRLQLHVLGAIAEFERDRIRERVRAGLARARAQGKRLGRPRCHPLPADIPAGLSVREAARLWRVSKSTAARRLSSVNRPPARIAAGSDGSRTHCMVDLPVPRSEPCPKNSSQREVEQQRAKPVVGDATGR